MWGGVDVVAVDYDQGLDLGGLAELFNDTDNRGGLSPVALPATNSQGKPTRSTSSPTMIWGSTLLSLE